MRQSSTFCFTSSELNSSSLPSFSPGVANNAVARHRIVPRRFKKKSEKANEDDNSMKAPDEKPETLKTKFTTPSAVTGEIPCHFEGSSYSSKLSSPNCFTFTSGEPITKEMQEKSEPKLPSRDSTQILPVFMAGEPITKVIQEKSEAKLPSRASTQIVIVSRILKGMPQNPHFLPLKSYSTVAKEKLINAWDNIFEETVDNLLSLQVNGFSADAKRLWETMEELEKMGYHVIPLRRRLVDLTDVIIRRRNRRTEIMRLKDEAEQHRMEKSRLEFEIAKLRAKVEAANASVEDIMGKVTKMEDEMPHFNDVFTKLAIKLF
ncbi:uncharacterized protein LOC141643036 isoform X2 [Silene latifolia]|uniref:uncharacterized protein LOC141643036 isoform X2 n=1 Tax=Silene latifolia TaxID=37657 RepID=UPI003D77DE5E